MVVKADATLKAQIMAAEAETEAPAEAAEAKRVPALAAATEAREATRKTPLLHRAAPGRVRPQGSSENLQESFMRAAVAAVFGLRSGSLAARAAVAPGLALA